MNCLRDLIEIDIISNASHAYLLTHIVTKISNPGRSIFSYVADERTLKRFGRRCKRESKNENGEEEVERKRREEVEKTRRSCRSRQRDYQLYPR